jgi:hypothetical protein
MIGLAIAKLLRAKTVRWEKRMLAYIFRWREEKKN